MTDIPTPKITLLTIPKELREPVYELILGTGGPYPLHVNIAKTLGHAYLKCFTGRAESAHTMTRVSGSGCLETMLVCRQLHDELEPFLCRHLHFDFENR